MATPKYTALATLTLTSAASSVTFGSIPAGYRDLMLVINGTVNANSNIVFYFNGDTANGTAVWMTGNGSTGSSSTIGFMFAGTWNASLDSSAIVEIADYSQTNKHTTALARADQAGAGTWAIANRWAQTTAVNSLTLDPTGGNLFNIGSTFDLFGVK